MCMIGDPISEPTRRPKTRPVVAYRVFQRTSRGNLRPIYWSTHFQYGPVRGATRRVFHTDIPGTFDHMGFWSYNTLAQAYDKYRHESGAVFAKVALFGTIVDHERGHRASTMRIRALYTKRQARSLLLKRMNGRA